MYEKGHVFFNKGRVVTAAAYPYVVPRGTTEHTNGDYKDNTIYNVEDLPKFENM